MGKRRNNNNKNVETNIKIKSSDSRKQVADKLNKQGKLLRGLITQDAFQNNMARLGFGNPNLAEGADYVMQRVSYNYNLFNAMYRGSWIARKIIDIMPADMMKNWIKYETILEPSKIKDVERTIKRTRTKEKIKDGLKWGRLYGGAGGLIIIDGDEDLAEPLDYDNIMPDSYKGILVFDRWTGIQPSMELEDDINDSEFGLPKYYSIDVTMTNENILNVDKSKLVKVHHSRILRFMGRDLPQWEKQYEMHWGESELEVVLEELKKRDNTSFNIASLIFLANIRVLKMSDLGQLLGSGSQLAQENLYKTIQAQSQLMSNMGIYVMDKEDDFSMHNGSFSGLSEVYESFMLDVAGACEMPVTKLFGRNPAGFNSTGESDLVQYYETIEEKQVEFLQPVLDKLLPVIFMSTLGAIPDDLDYSFNPCRSISGDEYAELASKMASPILDVYNAGLIDKATALRELKQQTEQTGMWSNITDELIEKAMQEDSQGELTDEETEQLYSDMNVENSQSESEVDMPLRSPDLSSDTSNVESNIKSQEQSENGYGAKLKALNEDRKNQKSWREKLFKR